MKCHQCYRWFTINVLTGIWMTALFTAVEGKWHFVTPFLCGNFYLAALYPLGVAHKLCKHE